MLFEEEISGFEGFLFIGDPHLASGRVGRRVDNYGEAILDKLTQAAKIANERNLYPVILGDLFHRARENDVNLLAKTIQVMRLFKGVPVMAGGSHDMTESWFTDKDAARLLELSGALHLCDLTSKVLTLDIKGEKVDLWMAPANSEVPTSLASDSTRRNILVTHHDFDFNGAYPGAQELREIEGCDILVNGHMHTPCERVVKGRTACHNPGSICRPSIDLKKHKPVVSVWTPAHGLGLEPVPLVVKDHTEVFDLTGKEIFAAEEKDLKASLPKGLRLSSFAAKLRSADSLEAGRTDDGSVLVEELDNYFKLFDKPPVLKTYITSLLQQTIESKR